MKTKTILLLGFVAVATVIGMSAPRFAEGEAEATASMPRKHCAVIGCAMQ
ncbi:hypothetical protein [Agrobacterium albertimagni]|nr:hypothetical protein [Agrobacterium albertimagni]